MAGCFTLASGPCFSGHIEGLIKDRESGNPLPGAHISAPMGGAVSDSLGRFSIETQADTANLEVSMIGYESKSIELPAQDTNITLYMTPETSLLEEVVIRDRMQEEHPRKEPFANSTEEFLEGLEGISSVSRANFAREPVLRGMRDDRIDVLVDGIRIEPACVDHMDPVTSYVDESNLSGAEISTKSDAETGSGMPGGSINLVSERPDFNRGFYGEAMSGFQSHNMGTEMRLQSGYSNQNLASQVTLSFENAGNYRHGQGDRIDHSGYNKASLKFDTDYRFNERQTGRFTYSGDLSWDIGYPGMIMDTEEARGQMISYAHEWENLGGRIEEITIKPYHTRVEHWMDDYERDVEEREVMQGMYMPMYGETQTTGGRIELSGRSDNHLYEATLHPHVLNAFADMEMEPLEEGVSDMYLFNIGNARLMNVDAMARYSWIANQKWTFSLNSGINYSGRALRESSTKSVFDGLYEDAETDRSFAGWNSGLSVAYSPTSELELDGFVGAGSRLPTHMEQYGYYIYEPVDDKFYHGNPGLSPENWKEAELGATFFDNESGIGLEASAFTKYFTDYIEREPLGGDFMNYTNFENALMAGGEGKVTFEHSRRLSFDLGGSYVYGENLDKGTPLKMIPPLEGSLGANWTKDRLNLHGNLTAVSSQDRTGGKAEPTTDGHLLVDIMAGYQFDAFYLEAVIKNLFDTHYRRHTSLGGIPEPGIDVGLRATYNW